MSIIPFMEFTDDRRNDDARNHLAAIHDRAPSEFRLVNSHTITILDRQSESLHFAEFKADEGGEIDFFVVSLEYRVIVPDEFWTLMRARGGEIR